MKSKLGILFGIIMQTGRYQEIPCVPTNGGNLGHAPGKSWRKHNQRYRNGICHFLLNTGPAHVEKGLDSATLCPLISMCLLTCLLLLTAKNISHQLPRRKVKEASFFACIFQAERNYLLQFSFLFV